MFGWGYCKLSRVTGAKWLCGMTHGLHLLFRAAETASCMMSSNKRSFSSSIQPRNQRGLVSDKNCNHEQKLSHGYALEAIMCKVILTGLLTTIECSNASREIR